MVCCRLCENPCYQTFNRWVLFGLTLLSFVFSIVTLASCTFGVKGGTRYGLFSYEDYYTGQCSPYLSVNAKDRTAEAFGVIASLSLGFALIGISLVIFVLRDKVARIVWLITRILYAAAFFGTCLTFTFIGSLVDGVCYSYFSYACNVTLGPAGTLTCLTLFILIGMLSVCFCVPIPAEPLCFQQDGCCLSFAPNGGASTEAANQQQPCRPQQNDVPIAEPEHVVVAPPAATLTTVRTIEITPDGRKITEVVTHPDGSKTVTNTFETDV